MALLLLGTLLAFGLGGSSPLPLPVVGGEPAPELAFEAVMEFENPLIGGCTGTLVRPDLLLTAGHCFPEGTTLQALSVSRPPSLGGGLVEVESFGTHPDMCLTCDRDEFDYGYIRFQEALAVPPLEIITDQDLWDASLYKGAEVTVVGWGNVPERGGLRGERWRVEVPIRGFTSTGIEFIAGGDGKDSCGGDSGGPALVLGDDGTWKVAGVTSRGSKPCGSGGFYGVAYHALEWLSEEVMDPSLCGADCGSCDCLDTRPPPDDGCCSTGRPIGIPWVLFALLWLRRRPSRRKKAPHAEA
ncbi:MAG: S1 family peptidase [Nannocystales bacterium]